MMNQKIVPGTNDAYLIGTIENNPKFVYNERGYRMFEGMASVPRLSGVVDHVPIVAEEEVMAGISAGDYVSINGVIRHRNRNVYPGCQHRLIVLADHISRAPSAWPAQSEIRLSGHLCKAPNYRITPKGREVCEIILAVPRGNGPQDYIVCIAWNSAARAVKFMNVGAALSASGRFQSRKYEKRKPDGLYEVLMAHEISLYSVTKLNP